MPTGTEPGTSITLSRTRVCDWELVREVLPERDCDPVEWYIDGLDAENSRLGMRSALRRLLSAMLDDLAHVFDALKETGLIEEAMIDGDVEAAVGLGVEEAFEAEGFHGGVC